MKLNGDPKCQRCTTMKVECVLIPTAAQSAKERHKENDKSKIAE